MTSDRCAVCGRDLKWSEMVWLCENKPKKLCVKCARKWLKKKAKS